MKSAWLLLLFIPLCLTTSLPAGKKDADPKPILPNSRYAGDGAVKTVKHEVQPLIDKHLAGAQDKMFAELMKGNQIPALGKTQIRRQGIEKPWEALDDLEGHALILTEFAKKGPQQLPLMLDFAGNFLERAHGQTDPLKLPSTTGLQAQVAFIIKVLDIARELHEAAFVKIKKEERKKLFLAAERFVTSFGPQLSVNDKTLPVLQNDRDFFVALNQVDWGKLGASAQVLATLTQPDFLRVLEKAVAKEKPRTEKTPGVTGEIFLHKETPHGLILIGGKGPNTYDLKVPVALLIDLGGDDTYKGKLAASFDTEHPLSALIDLAGKDSYQCGDMGLATGRLGVGLMCDFDGDDTYSLAPGSGGVGLGGIGVLMDTAGNDKYEGSRFTQGAAVQGLGLLWDLAGNDKHTSYGFAVGLGGPGGIGIILDNAGNDSYQCGHKYPSGYNQSDAPNAKPGEAGFQWDCFGLAMGLGRRVWPPTPEHMQYNLAGGFGIVLDLAGDDRYHSSNFSQACGYFFGTGLLLDLQGNDYYQAARYGMSSGAHYGLGLFVDYQGKDTYQSDGPTYNAAASWDRSVFLFIDAGIEDDTYVLDKSAGLGRADHGSWAVCADLGGNDRYVAPASMAATSDNSLAVFLDHAGKDDYGKTGPLGKQPAANGQLHSIGEGGLFIDAGK